MQLTIIFIIFSTLILNAKIKDSSVVLRPLHYIRGCNIYDYSEKLLARFPGKFCTFLNNGSYLLIDIQGLKFYDKNDNMVWKNEGHFHHQLKMANNEKNILAIASYVSEIEGKKSRVDKLIVYDLKGNILHENNIENIFSHKKIKPKLYGTDQRIWFKSADIKVFKDVLFESSHVNSFYLIPQHTKKSLYDIFPPGGYIVTTKPEGIFTLSADLKNVLYHFNYFENKINEIHDVQVLNNGNITLFVNENKNEKNNFSHSAVVEIEMPSKKIVWSFTSSPESLFYSPYCGGVQMLEGNLVLISDVMKGFFVVNKLNKKLVHYSYLTGVDHFGRIIETQDIKALNLEDFFKNRPNLEK